MKQRTIRFAELLIVLSLLVGSGLLPSVTPTVYAEADEAFITLTPSGPTYARVGANITYEYVLKNFLNESVTDIVIWNPLPANTTYVSGGTLLAADNGVLFEISSLAAKATKTFTMVVKVNNGVALGTVIENKDIVVENFTVGPDSYETSAETAVGTTIEAPGTVTAIYKNASGRAFDVTVDGFQFENFSNEPPRVFKDDLASDDIFALFGPAACTSGTTAATCVLSGPARKWMLAQIADMGFGHCEGMAATSLRLFDERPFKGKAKPADFQSGAASTSNLNFPAQVLENYISYYFITQTVDEYYDAQIVAGPVEIVNRLTADFNKTNPVPYTMGIYKMPGFKAGHAITAYGVEKVNAGESRILIYDNNYPKQRQYITVNMNANTWRYVTAAVPGETPDVYTGTATSGNLSIQPNNARDLPAGEYFTCPFCPNTGVQAADAGQTDATISFQYSGEGALLVTNNDDQSTGFAFDIEEDINEIPGAELIYFNGGLGYDVPPRIVVPVVETDGAFNSVFISGKGIDDVAAGALSITGEGYVVGLDAIQLDPDEFLEIAVSQDGTEIAFRATETIEAPSMYISYDPVSAEDPSIIFQISGIILDAGEESSLVLDPDLERVYFDDTSGGGGQEVDVTMSFIWPDGDEEDYVETIDVPDGSSSAFIDFGAWDGLLDPSIYVDDLLQNPSVNHRLKLVNSTGTYDPTPQTDAPAGVYHVEATFTNVTEVVLGGDIYFTVVDLGEGNLLLNADGGPAGVDGELLVSQEALGGDGLLDANESFTVTFDVGLASAGMTTFTVDANGEPWDWTPDADPAPAYDANDASFEFDVNAISTGGRNIFLPLLQN